MYKKDSFVTIPSHVKWATDCSVTKCSEKISDLDLLPSRPDKSGHEESFILCIKLHDTRGLKLLSDPVCLLLVVDKHKLHPDMVTVGILGN